MTAGQQAQLQQLEKEKEGILKSIELLTSSDQVQVVNSLKQSVQVLDSKIDDVRRSAPTGSASAATSSFNHQIFQQELDELKNEIEIEIRQEVQSMIQELRQTTQNTNMA